jgi:hypothetical protein
VIHNADDNDDGDGDDGSVMLLDKFRITRH